MVEVSFYLLSLVALTMLIFLFRGYSIREKSTAFIFISGWFVYLILLDQFELLKNFELPPRIPLLVVTPAIASIILFVNKKWMSKALKNSPLYLPIFLQSFRILVELLIYATYQKGIFPQRATFEGMNFDILVGISALLMAFAVKKGVTQVRGIIIWNVASLGVLTVTVYSFISTYYFTEFSSMGDKYQFVEFPYLLLASVLLPIAIFLHVFSLKQALNKRQTS